jgi:hypothetical protein
MRGSGTGLPVQQLFSTKSCRILRPGADIIETMSDLELLDQYARENRQDAFSTLLDRHLRLVYSAALRQVRSPELAEEVAQSVFADLARNAGFDGVALSSDVPRRHRCCAPGIAPPASRANCRGFKHHELKFNRMDRNRATVG